MITTKKFTERQIEVMTAVAMALGRDVCTRQEMRVTRSKFTAESGALQSRVSSMHYVSKNTECKVFVGKGENKTVARGVYKLPILATIKDKATRELLVAGRDEFMKHVGPTGYVVARSSDEVTPAKTTKKAVKKAKTTKKSEVVIEETAAPPAKKAKKAKKAEVVIEATTNDEANEANA